MAEDTKITNPVEIKSNSKERVAFDLMKHISLKEKRQGDNQQDRKHWLTLYSQCLKATYGFPLESILKEE
jgi:hypothetical protein